MILKIWILLQLFSSLYETREGRRLGAYFDVLVFTFCLSLSRVVFWIEMDDTNGFETDGNDNGVFYIF